MRYDERCEIVIVAEKDGYLGKEPYESERKKVSCSVNDVGLKEQQLVFGTFKRLALKIHVQGRHSVSKVIYKGHEYVPATVKYHKNSTVMVVGS